MSGYSDNVALELLQSADVVSKFTDCVLLKGGKGDPLADHYYGSGAGQGGGHDDFDTPPSSITGRSGAKRRYTHRV